MPKRGRKRRSCNGFVVCFLFLLWLPLLHCVHGNVEHKISKWVVGMGASSCATVMTEQRKLFKLMKSCLCLFPAQQKHCTTFAATLVLIHCRESHDDKLLNPRSWKNYRRIEDINNMMPKPRKKMTTIFLVDTSPFPSPHSRHSIDFVEYHRHRKKETSHSKVNTRLRMKIAAWNRAAVVGVYCALRCVSAEKLNKRKRT